MPPKRFPFWNRQAPRLEEEDEEDEEVAPDLIDPRLNRPQQRAPPRRAPNNNNINNNNDMMMMPRQARPVINNNNNAPRGNYRRGNNTLAQVVSWACTLWLNEEDINAVNNIHYVPNDPAPNPLPAAHLVYIRRQLERGANGQDAFGGNRLHLQMTLDFSERVSAFQVVDIMGWQNIPPDDIWLQPINGNKLNWMNYCWKDETCVDIRTRHEAGEHRPFNVAQVPQQIRNMVLGDGDFDEIADAFPDYALRHANSIMKQITEYERNAEPLERFVNAYCFWGDTGTGKTHSIWKSFPKSNIYTKTTGKFYEGYNPKKQNILIIDESPAEFSMEDLLKIIQGHPQIVEIKGGSVRARWDTVFCTSNKPPSQWFRNADQKHVEALLRRFNKGIFKFVDSSNPNNIAQHEKELKDASYKIEHEKVKYIDCEAIKREERKLRDEATRDRPDPFANFV